MFVTTALDPSVESLDRAQRLAESLQCSCVSRKDYSLAKLQSMQRDLQLLLVTENELKYVYGDHPPLFFHPSTALLRIKRLMRGEPDVLMEVAGVKSGDTVLDCTAGLAADAIVFSYAVGASGRVTALESETAAFVLLQEGLKRYDSEVVGLNEAMRRVRPFHTDHLTHLKQLPDRSEDIVYFDPMFRNPIEEASSIHPLRAIANPRPIELSAVQEACRVARRTVVLKEHRDSGEFSRLGFSKKNRAHAKFIFGVIEL